MSAKETVKKFYESDLVQTEDIMDLFHKKVQLQWHSTQGFRTLDYQGIKDTIEIMRKSYLSFQYRLSHLLEDGDMVTARYTIYVTPIERPNKEDPFAHFITIWKIKNGKLFKGFEISQLADSSSESLNSFGK